MDKTPYDMSRFERYNWLHKVLDSHESNASKREKLEGELTRLGVEWHPDAQIGELKVLLNVAWECGMVHGKKTTDNPNYKFPEPPQKPKKRKRKGWPFVGE